MFQRPSLVRSAALRKSALSFAKAFSMGLKSGPSGDIPEHWRVRVFVLPQAQIGSHALPVGHDEFDGEIGRPLRRADR